jgi:hypothetical protein
MFHPKSHGGLISYIRLWVVSTCLVLIGAGIVILLFHIPESTKYFVSGALLGVGCGGALNEVVSAPDRRESAKRLNQLRSTVFAKYRLAYRMGDFVFNFSAALSKGDQTDPEVATFLNQGEVLGIRASLAQVVENADPSRPSLHDDIRKRVDEALSFSGGNLDSFFEIAQYLHALRGDDANEKPEARKLTAAALAESLKDIEGLIDGVDASKAWEKIYYFWDKADLNPKEIYLLLTVFHLFFWTLEDYTDAYEAWKEIVIKLSKIKARDGRPPGLVSVLSVLAVIGAEDPNANAAPTPSTATAS